MVGKVSWSDAKEGYFAGILRGSARQGNHLNCAKTTSKLYGIERKGVPRLSESRAPGCVRLWKTSGSPVLTLAVSATSAGTTKDECADPPVNSTHEGGVFGGNYFCPSATIIL
jgi:hypothetical protein